jgi:dsDNA-specific endonuclease/ATPase MutS2
MSVPDCTRDGRGSPSADIFSTRIVSDIVRASEKEDLCRRRRKKELPLGGKNRTGETGETSGAVVVPVEDWIDLHTFRPSEVKYLLEDYLEAAAVKGFREVRIIHGKGTGVLMRLVGSVLQKHPLVESFHPADEGGGGWGAAIAVLRKRAK